MKSPKFLKSRAIQAALITALVAILGWFVYGNSVQQNHSGSGDNVTGDKTTNNYSADESPQIKDVDHVLLELTYTLPVLMSEDDCDDKVCVGEYILTGESADTIRVDPPQCTEFNPTSYRYDSGPYDPETGEYTKLISDFQGKNVRTCGWIEIPKSRIISKKNSLFQETTNKNIYNYDTYRSDGAIIVQ